MAKIRIIFMNSCVDKTLYKANGHNNNDQINPLCVLIDFAGRGVCVSPSLTANSILKPFLKYE